MIAKGSSYLFPQVPYLHSRPFYRVKFDDGDNDLQLHNYYVRASRGWCPLYKVGGDNNKLYGSIGNCKNKCSAPAAR